MSITALPTPPTRGESSTVFSQKASAWVDALGNFTNEANDMADDLNQIEFNCQGAEIVCNTAIQTTHYKGEWSSLTGSLNIPSSVSHDGQLWLLKNYISNVTTQEPTESNSNWLKLENGGNSIISGMVFDNIMRGDLVVRDEMGIMYKARATSDYSPLQVTSEQVNVLGIFKISESGAIAFFRKGDNYVYASTLTFSLNEVSSSSLIKANGVDTYGTDLQIRQIDSTLFVIIFRRNSDQKVYACLMDVGMSSITMGNIVALTSYTTVDEPAIAYVGIGKLCALYTHSNSTKLLRRAMTYSGMTITLGTEYQDADKNSSYSYHEITAIGNSVFVTYRASNNHIQGYVVPYNMTKTATNTSIMVEGSSCAHIKDLNEDVFVFSMKMETYTNFFFSGKARIKTRPNGDGLFCIVGADYITLTEQSLAFFDAFPSEGLGYRLMHNSPKQQDGWISHPFQGLNSSEQLYEGIAHIKLKDNFELVSSEFFMNGELQSAHICPMFAGHSIIVYNDSGYIPYVQIVTNPYAMQFVGVSLEDKNMSMCRIQTNGEVFVNGYVVDGGQIFFSGNGEVSPLGVGYPIALGLDSSYNKVMLRL